jgi:recombination protein RecA
MPDRNKLNEAAVSGLIKGMDKTKDDDDEGCSVATLSNPSSLCVVKEWIPSGCFPLDLIMGGGFPVGRITEIYGENSTGKSLLATHAIIQGQALGALTVFADVESSVSKPLMEKLGVDVSTLIYFTPDTVNQVFEVWLDLIERKDKELGKDYPMVFVWDSVAATTTRAEMEEEDLDKKMYASAAPQISRAMRTMARKIARSSVCAIFTNQVRDNIGVMFGEKITTYGGKAIRFHASVRIELKTNQTIKDGDKKDSRKIGIWVDACTSKNRLAPPFQSVKVPIYFGYGIDDWEATLTFAKELEVVTGGEGGRYKFPLESGEDLSFTKKTWYDLQAEHGDRLRELIAKTYAEGL